MPNVFDGTNPITDILGDEPTEREVTMENQSTMTIIEPLTNTQIPAGQTVLVRVIGDIAHSTLVKNIQQINALQGLEVVGLTSVISNAAGAFIGLNTDETVDGEYQQFSKSSDPHPVFGLTGFSADLGDERVNLAAAFAKVSFKIPDLTDDGQFFSVVFSETDITDIQFESSAFFQMQVAGQNLSSTLKIDSKHAGAQLKMLELPAFEAGQEVQMYFHPSHIRLVYANGQSSLSLTQQEADDCWSGVLFNAIIGHLSLQSEPQSVSVKFDGVRPITDLPAEPIFA